MKNKKCRENCIGISDDRMMHILSVARQSYYLAKEKYDLPEEDCKKAFLIGFLHDIGYEFSEEKSKHPMVGADLLSNYCDSSIITPIATHGNASLPVDSIMCQILNEADMTISSNGELITMEKRLDDIELKYGRESSSYIEAKKMMNKLLLFNEI